MAVHVINLDRDPERLARFHRLNAHLPEVIRLPAVDGSTLDRRELEANGYILAGLRYSNGSLGCALSHIALWRQAIREQKPITVAEDDAVFAPDFITASGALLGMLPADWDIVLWGWNFDALLWVEIPEGVSACRIEFNQNHLRENIEVFRTRKYGHAPLRLRHAFGNLCYSVSPAGARTLLDNCLPLGDPLVKFPGYGVVIENKTFDSTMNRIYPQLKAYACMPPLAVSENRHETSHTRRG